MSLPNEIRQVLSKMFTRADTIRWRVGQDRIKREDYSSLQCLKTFTNYLAGMDDVEAGTEKGKRVWRRNTVEIKEQGMAYHIRCILMIITVEGKRLWESLALEKRKRLMSKLEKIRLSIIRMLKRYER